eukprot:276113_1
MAQQRVQQTGALTNVTQPFSQTSHSSHPSAAPQQVSPNYSNVFAAQPSHGNAPPNTSTTAVTDTPQSMSHSQHQSPSYHPRVVSQPSFNTKSTSGGGMTSSPQPHTANVVENFSFVNTSGLSTANVEEFENFSFGTISFASESTDDAVISEKVNPELDEEIFQHRPVKAWRWDVEQKKWRGR